jgi:hypothetical protein
MARDVEFGRGALGKVRSFWVGLFLTIITFGIYYYVWYYLLNDELRDIGIANDEPNLAGSKPAVSVAAVLFGGILLVPPLISVYNFGQRIKRAQRLCGIPMDETINPVTAFLLLFPGGLLIVPTFIHYWYITKHQNAAVLAAAETQPVSVSDARLAFGSA